ncbi:VOC family protein [Ornithinimicrobium sp. Y1847]|uniref:VOC family protein n=1 Tax=unclassified Ornithinimicrobium TaxID=2615080 RepID=UPI003B68425A
MHDLIFVNLPVADLDRSRAFFTALGYTFNEEFCDGDALCLELGPTLAAMLLRHELFASFLPGRHDGHDWQDVADGHGLSPQRGTTIAEQGTSEVLLCLSVASREAVDELVERAIAAGGRAGRSEDHGWMYGRSYVDLDGHVWEMLFMDEAAREEG